MRRVLLPFVALVVVASLLVGAFGCAPEEPEKFEWKLSAEMSMEEFMVGVIAQHFCDEVFARTDGRLEITVYPSNELGYKASEYLRALDAGYFDMINLSVGFVAGDFPLINMYGLPFLFPSPDVMMQGVDLVDKKIMYPLIERDFDLVYLWTSVMPGQHIWSKEPLASPDDLKGLKIRSYSKALSDTLSPTGASPQVMESSEVYMALQRGVIDAFVTSGTTAYATKSYEVIDYCNITYFLYGGIINAVNKASFDSLPPDIQTIVRQVANEMSDWSLEQTKKYDKIDMDNMASQGVQMITLPADVRSVLTQAAKENAWESKITDCENAGYGAEGREMLRQYLTMVGTAAPNWL